MRGIENQLYVEPTDGGHTCEEIIKFIGDDQAIFANIPKIRGGSANVISLTKAQMISVINAKQQANLSFNTYDIPVGEHKLRDVVVEVMSGQLTVKVVLNRRIGKKLLKYRLLQRNDLSVHSVAPGPSSPCKLKKFKKIQQTLI